MKSIPKILQLNMSLEVLLTVSFVFFRIVSADVVILGGTHQENDYNTHVNADDTKFIYDGCMKLLPSIKRAQIIKEMAGLRPGRSSVRLEHDTFTTSNVENALNY